MRERILDRRQGTPLRQTASILNEQGWIPLKSRAASRSGNIFGLLRTSDATKVLTKRFLQMMLTKMERAHDAENPPTSRLRLGASPSWRDSNGSWGYRRGEKTKVVARAGAGDVMGAVRGIIALKMRVKPSPDALSAVFCRACDLTASQSLTTRSAGE